MDMKDLYERIVRLEEELRQLKLKFGPTGDELRAEFDKIESRLAAIEGSTK